MRGKLLSGKTPAAFQFSPKCNSKLVRRDKDDKWRTEAVRFALASFSGYSRKRDSSIVSEATDRKKLSAGGDCSKTMSKVERFISFGTSPLTNPFSEPIIASVSSLGMCTSDSSIEGPGSWQCLISKCAKFVSVLSESPNVNPFATSFVNWTRFENLRCKREARHVIHGERVGIGGGRKKEEPPRNLKR